MEDPESEIHIERLLKLKRVFEEADEDGSGELDIDEFVEKIGPHLGDDLTKTQLTQLFMKIDADAGGTVDWDEFTNYMFLQRADPDADDCENWRFFPQDFRERNDAGCHHRSPVAHLLNVEHGERYLTSGRDGTLRVWNASDLKHIRTMMLNPTAWVTGSVYLPQSRRIAVSASDGTIVFCGMVRGSHDLLGRVDTRGHIGIPQCLCLVVADEEEYVAVGDDQGHVSLLLDEPDATQTTNAMSQTDSSAFEILHQHTDWVTQVRDVKDVGLMSSSLDATLRLYDLARGRLVQSYGHHQRGVHCFEWCSAYSLFASAGVERNILLWQAGTQARLVGELVGHTSSVVQLSIDEKTNNIISLSLDRTVKVWDLRNHKCLQTIETDDWPKHVDSQANCMTYDSVRRRLVTCSNRIVVWPHKLTSQDKSGHQYPVREATYNRTFHVAVSADEEGTICVWNMDDGSRESKFSASHGPQARLTAVTFDANQRRLLTAANSPSLRMWNFNSGSLLREYVHGIEDLEITAALFIEDETSGADRIIACGWGSKIFVWYDDDEDEILEYKTLDGHKEDILHMAACQEKDLMATGDYEGRILIWKLSTGVKRMGLFHRADRYEASVDRLVWLLTHHKGDSRELLLLLSAGGDGIIRVWVIAQEPTLITTIAGAHGRLEQVSALAQERGLVAVGDTGGHLRVLDVAEGVDVSTRLAAKESFRQVAHWRGHDGAVAGIDFVALEDGGCFLLTCSKDANVILWTTAGGCVGHFGVDGWRLDDPDTWRDPDGQQMRPPASAYEDMFVKAHQEKEESGSVEERDASPLFRLEQSLRRRRSDQLSETCSSRQDRLRTYELSSLPSTVSTILERNTKAPKKRVLNERLR